MNHKYQVYYVLYPYFQIRIKNLEDDTEYFYDRVFTEEHALKLVIHFLDYEIQGYNIIIRNLNNTDETKSIRLTNFKFSLHLEEMLIKHLSSKCSTLNKETFEVISTPDLLEGL